MAVFDSKDLRLAWGHFLTGITIVTVRSAGGIPHGVTVNSFTSVSLDPPLVLVCLDNRLGSYHAFRIGCSFAVHVLADHQAELSHRFAQRGTDKFAGLSWRDGLDGVPILADYLALFECRVVDTHASGDHTIFIGQVERIDTRADRRLPLGFFRGNYIKVQEARRGDTTQEPEL
jgi:3-hydroxy-9,10-secoandrosta-1,3,5(10)-triene-9,17-dione monooxygenase reductase component